MSLARSIERTDHENREATAIRNMKCILQARGVEQVKHLTISEFRNVDVLNDRPLSQPAKGWGLVYAVIVSSGTIDEIEETGTLESHPTRLRTLQCFCDPMKTRESKFLRSL